MSKRQILVDFDHTLFNTEKFKEILKTGTIPGYPEFLYDDAPQFLEYAREYGELALLSEGEPDFQKEKIEKSGISKFFSEVKIFPSFQKSTYFAQVSDKPNVILIDDKPDIIDEAVSVGLTVIRVKRGKYKDAETKFRPRYVVNSLQEIIDKDILKNV
jgi:FMN phosphatase YigB (HAD superfamily)